MQIWYQTCGWCLGYILFTTLESAGYISFSQVLSSYHFDLHTAWYQLPISWSQSFPLITKISSKALFPSNATILISFIQFLLFWGIVFLVTTTLIGDHFYKTFTLFAFGQHWSYNLFSSAIFKREKNSAGASTVGPDGIKLSNTLLMLNCFLLCIFCTHHHHKQYMFRWNHWSRTWTWPSWHL